MEHKDNTSLKSENETRKKLTLKITPIISKNGFQSLKMEEIARLMNISKGTLYKYFSSKEEVIEAIINDLVVYIDGFSIAERIDLKSYIDVFNQLFEQTILLGAYVPEIFLNDLEKIYPDLYNRLKDSMNRNENEIRKFYIDGKKKDVFNDINESLIFLQNYIFVRSFLDMKFLINNNMTLKKSILDFYNLTKYQLIKADKFYLINESEVIEKIDYLSNKITRDLF